VPDVIDAWFDSGAMPFAQVGYPLLGELDYPAQFICEAIDQTRGWFYSLLAVGTLVVDKSPYENVACLGLILAEDGRKMSKHLGNVMAPIPLMDRHGADALRWFMLCAGSPWSDRRIGDAALDEIVRRVLLTYWNTVSFFSVYAAASGWSPADEPAAATPADHPMDRWLLAELNHVVGAVDDALENFDTAGAGRMLGQFVDDLSNWYVRLSRGRFWSGDPVALATLYRALDVLTRLLAPLIPFLTEYVWQRLGGASSVHLDRWPETDPAARDDALRSQMAVVRAIVDAGRAARKAAEVRVRQPLARGLVGGHGPAASDLPPAELLALAAEELNVHELAPLTGDVLDVTVKPNFRALGRRFGPRTQQVAAAIAADHAAAVTAFDLTPDDLIVTRTPRAGWAVAAERGVTVALDTTITPELRRAGLAREAVRLIQDARKQAGLAVTDRIVLRWSASGDMALALREHTAEVAAAVLAVSMTEDADGACGDEPHFSLRRAA
jgi:isoleucyl-tRNA synthetase